MMEFITSRVCLTVCGLVLLAAVSVPVIFMYGGSVDGRMQSLADDAAGLMDRFDRSSADVMTLSMREILPDAGSSMTVDGHLLMLDKDGKRYIAATSADLGSGTFSYGDIVEVKRTENGLSITALAHTLK